MKIFNIIVALILSYLNLNVHCDFLSVIEAASTNSSESTTRRIYPYDRLQKLMNLLQTKRVPTVQQDSLIANPCWSSPCENDSKCYGALHLYICLCAANYTGRNCEVKIEGFEACARCNYRGMCLSDGIFQRCKCATGYSGSFCESQSNSIESELKRVLAPERFKVLTTPMYEGIQVMAPKNQSSLATTSNVN